MAEGGRGLLGAAHRAVGEAQPEALDTVGRSVVAPAQVPAGLVVAMIGTPYFLFLLYRSRA